MTFSNCFDLKSKVSERISNLCASDSSAVLLTKQLLCELSEAVTLKCPQKRCGANMTIHQFVEEGPEIKQLIFQCSTCRKISKIGHRKYMLCTYLTITSALVPIFAWQKNESLSRRMVFSTMMAKGTEKMMKDLLDTMDMKPITHQIWTDCVSMYSIVLVNKFSVTFNSA